MVREGKRFQVDEGLGFQFFPTEKPSSMMDRPFFSHRTNVAWNTPQAKIFFCVINFIRRHANVFVL